MILDVRKISLETIPHFILRDADEAECRAGGMSGEEAVRRSVASSDAAYAYYCNEELLCFWGYRIEDNCGDMVNVWCLSMPPVFRHRIAFARASREVNRMLGLLFPKMRVAVHEDYATSRYWLEWLGFKPTGTWGKNFIVMQKDVV